MEDVFLVAVLDEELVGFASFSPISETGGVELAAIYVLPAMQGRGIGTRLLGAGIERFPSATGITLRAESENAPARRFYENRGFTEGEHSAQRLSGHELHTAEMTLSLA